MIADLVDLSVAASGSSRFDEERDLDRAIGADDLLIASLQEDERRRRWRWRIWIGAVVALLLLGSGGFATLLLLQEEPEEKAAALSKEGWQLWQAGKLDQAETIFAEAVKLNPKAEHAWNGLGWARLNQAKYEPAIEAFRKCVELADNHPGANNGLGQAYLAMKKHDEAEKYLLKAAPEGSAAWVGLARLYLVTGQFDKALPYAEKVAALDPNNEYFKKMLAAAKAKELDDSLKKILDPPKPSGADVAAAKAWQTMRTVSLVAGREAFEQVLADAPDNLSANNGIGFCLLNLGDAAKAKPYFEKCLKLEPNAGGALNGLARCLKAEGKTDEAIKLWEKLEELSPTPTAGAVGLAQTYLELKQYEKAVKYYEELVKAQPQAET
ncbi:MAG: tetratricopeptide repeat protein, partial [Planctomycetota bacterium]